MIKRLWKKGCAVFLAVVLTAGTQQMGAQPMTVYAAEDVKTMNLNPSCLAPSDGSWDVTNDYKVYFGQYNNLPTAFRVLKADGTTIMLDCDTILVTKPFDADAITNATQTSGYRNEWSGSDLEGWLNGSDYYSNTSIFTSVEKSAIKQTTFTDNFISYQAGYGRFIDYAATNYVWLLSAKEVDELYADNAARLKTGTVVAWWLRSADVNAVGDVGLVDYAGDIRDTHAHDNIYVGVCPAFNINSASVLFISMTEVNKSSDSLTQITANGIAKEWKLTLYDSGKTVAVTGGQVVTQSGDLITVPYTYTGSDVSQISVMITDKAYNEADSEILYYGKLNTNLNSTGIGTFTLPSGLPYGYRMYILAEDVNGEKLTDYSSKPEEITIAKIVETPNADLTGTTYTEDKALTLSSQTAGATIYYTMTNDGTEPAEPTVSDIVYNGVVSLTGIAGSNVIYRIKAIAVKEGMIDSGIATFSYQIFIPKQNNTTNLDTNKEEMDEVPKTGDDTSFGWLLVLLIGSGALLCFTQKNKE